MRAAATITAFIALLTSLFIAHTTASASGSQDANQGLLCGRVLAANQATVADATVFVIPADGDTPTAASVTDDKGYFSFSDLPPGRYVLLAIHGHHSPGRSDPVVVGKLGSPFPIKLTLASEAIEL